jgi:hypothetical protein
VSRVVVSVLVLPAGWWVWKGRVWWCGVCARCWVPVLSGRVWPGVVVLPVVGGGWRRLGVLFENCIVDASIFVVFVVGLFGDKLLRAIGGCLGIKSR